MDGKERFSDQCEGSSVGVEVVPLWEDENEKKGGCDRTDHADDIEVIR